MSLTGVITGKNGAIKTGNAVLGSATDFKVTEFSFSKSGGAIPVPDSSSGDSVPHVPGKRVTTTGSFSAIRYYGVSPLSVNTEYEAHLLEEKTSGDEVYHSGKIIITDHSRTVSIEGEDKVMDSYNFTVNGALTPTDNSAA